jgi:sec-independent protein translocase protein TatC
LLSHYRRHALVGSFVLGAFITPTPDPLNQTIVSVPIYLLYELGVLLTRFA